RSLQPCSSSPQVEECKNEDPDEIDEVPVQAHDLDAFVIASPAREETPRAGVIIAAPDLARDDQEEDHAERDMRAVEAGDHEERCAELLGTPWISPRPHALAD